MFRASLNTIVTEALLSLQLHGIELSQPSLNLFKLIVDEEITPSQARRMFFELLEECRKTHPQWFGGNNSQAGLDKNNLYYPYDEVIKKLCIVDEGCKEEVKGFLTAINNIEEETGLSIKLQCM